MGRHGHVSILVVSFLFSLLLLVPADGAEKPVVLKIGTLAPEGSAWVKAFKTLSTEIADKTGNRVSLKIYPGGVLGDEVDMLRKMRIGQLQGAALTSASLSLLYKEMDVLQIPFLFERYEEVDHVLKSMDAFFRKGVENSGYVTLGWSEVGFIYLMSTVPVSGLPDLKKAKVWVWEDSPMAKAIFGEAGVKAIPLSVPDVLVGLQTGIVEVVYAPPSAAISLQWFTKVKYITDVPLAYLAGGVVVKKESFDQIPASFQKIVLERVQHHLEQLKGVTRNENRDAMKVMTKQGVKIVTSSKHQIEEFKRLSNEALRRPGAQNFSKKTLEDLTLLLENYRKGGK